MLGTDYEEKHLCEVFARYSQTHNHQQAENLNSNLDHPSTKIHGNNYSMEQAETLNGSPNQLSQKSHFNDPAQGHAHPFADHYNAQQAEKTEDTHHLQSKETPNKEGAKRSTITLSDGNYKESSTRKKSETIGSSITTNYVQPLPPIITKESKLRLVTDLQSCVKASLKGLGASAVAANYYYARKVRISNLQKMAETVAYAQEHGFDSYGEVEKTHEDALEKLRVARKKFDSTKEQLQEVNEQIHFTGQYLSTKKAYIGYKKAKNKDRYRFEHQADLVKFEASRDYLKKRAAHGKLPTLAELKEEKKKLVNRRETLYEALENNRTSFKEINTMRRNMDAILAIPDELRQPVRDRSRPVPAHPSR